MINVNIQRSTHLSQRNGLMKYSHEAKKFAQLLISLYAEFDSLSESQRLNILDVSDFHTEEFASILMRNGDVSESESTSFDNPAYQDYMLPALTRYLANTSDKSLEQEFTNKWRDGVTSYYRDKMQEIINDQLN